MLWIFCVGVYLCEYLRKKYDLCDEFYNICINYFSNVYKININIWCMIVSCDCLICFIKYR